MAFSLAAYTLRGDLLGSIPWKEGALTRTLSGGLRLEFGTWLADAPPLRTSETHVRLREDDELLFGGIIAPPLEMVPEGVKVQCVSPFLDLSRQRVDAYQGGPATSLEFIVHNLLYDENIRANTHLGVTVRQGDPLPNVAGYLLQEGSDVQEAILTLATGDPGFWFKENPVDSATLAEGAWSALTLYNAASSGVDLSGSVRFEYGPGTKDNLQSYDLSDQPVVNGVTAAGTVNDAPVNARAEDAGSIEEFGLREEYLSLSDASSIDVLNAAAAAALRPTPQRALSFVVEKGEEVPRFLRDFDIGDLIGVLVMDGELQLELAVRIVEGRLLLPDDETVAGQELTVEVAG
jgi:hypothetical protein